MTNETQSRMYNLAGIPVVPEDIKALFPTVGNLLYDEKGKEVIARLNERFRGVPSVSYEGIRLRDNHPITHSNNPRAIGIDALLLELVEPEMHVITPKEFIAYMQQVPDKPGTYADCNAVSVGFKQGPNEDLKQALIKEAGINSPKETVIVIGLGIDRVEDKRGFAYRKTDRTTIVPASELRALAEKAGVPFYCSDEGLGGVSRSGDGLGADWGDGLVVANGCGRVQVAQAPKARSAKNIEALAKLEAEVAREKASIEERLKLAVAKKGSSWLLHI